MSRKCYNYSVFYWVIILKRAVVPIGVARQTHGMEGIGGYPLHSPMANATPAFSLFNDPVGLERVGRLYQAVDRLKVKLSTAALTDGLCLEQRSGENRLKILVLNIKVM